MTFSENNQKSAIRLAVFLQIAGKKWDQMAGFKLYATKNKLGPMSIKEWQNELKNFMDTPTR